MIPLKQNDIPALIVNTPGFGQAPLPRPLWDWLAAPRTVCPSQGWSFHAERAVETLALPAARPYQPFPPSSPPHHRGETVALFREKNMQPRPRECRGRCIAERGRGGRQRTLDCEPVMGREPYLPL